MDIPLSDHYVSIDEMLGYVGEFGRFQWMIQSLLCIMQFPPTFPPLIMYFAALTPDWRCTGGNNTYCNSTKTFPSEDHTRCNMPREAWEYVKPKDYSVVTQFDINCSDHWLIYLTTSICFAGMAVGSIAMGWLGDKYGRKKVLFPCMFLLCLVGLVSAFVPSIEWFLICRFLVGFLRSGTSVFMILIASELTGSKYRPLAGTSLRMILPIANCVLGVQAYYANTWSTLCIVCSAPYFLTLLSYKLIPESIRWLRINGKQDKVMETFEKIAKSNKKVIPPNIKLSPLIKNITIGKAGISQLFHTQRRALSTINLGFAWMITSMVYYGVSLAADDLGGSLYTNFILISLVEFPAGVVAVYLLNTFGRKKTIIFTLLLGSLGCVGLSALPTVVDFKIARFSLGLLSKFLITISYSSIYTWTVEIFPTTVRAAGMGFTQFTSRVGAVGAPFVAKGLKLLHPIAPFLFMGVVGSLTSTLLILLPETKGRPTKETMHHRPTVAVIHNNNDHKSSNYSNPL